MNPSLSVVIPTHKRAAILRQTLEHLERQTIADKIEVIVVSDGHDDDTVKLFENPTSYKLSAISFFEIPKSQQGVARNRGVQKASAPITLFIGDDCFLMPDACEKHLEIHGSFERSAAKTNQKAILGFTTWDPSVGITPVMKWLEESGWQFGYQMIAAHAGKPLPTKIQHKFTYTIHISLPTEIARAHPFREDLTLYGWEDILWGAELAKAGVPLIYAPQAMGLHHHHFELEESLKRMVILGRSAVIIAKGDPTFDRIPKGWKALALRIISKFPTMRGVHTKEFLRGIRGI